MAIKTTDIPGELRSFWKIFDRICYRHDYARVFDSFVTMTLTQFTPPGEFVDRWHSEAMSPFNQEEKQNFNLAYTEFLKIWIEQTEDSGYYDFFGDLYQTVSSRFKSSKMGQFFTPTSLSNVMAHLLGEPEKVNAYVSDPTSGSGRTLLAYHNLYSKFDPIYIAEDLDPICAKMTALNMCLHGMRGEVVCHDALCDLEDFSFAFHVNSLAQYRSKGMPHIVVINKDESIYLKMMKNRLESIVSEGKSKEEAKAQVKAEIQQSQQLNLFN